MDENRERYSMLVVGCRGILAPRSKSVVEVLCEVEVGNVAEWSHKIYIIMKGNTVNIQLAE